MISVVKCMLPSFTKYTCNLFVFAVSVKLTDLIDINDFRFVEKLALQLFSGDVSQAAYRILNDFRKGKFGWVALERPRR